MARAWPHAASLTARQPDDSPCWRPNHDGMHLRSWTSMAMTAFRHGSFLKGFLIKDKLIIFK